MTTLTKPLVLAAALAAVTAIGAPAGNPWDNPTALASPATARAAAEAIQPSSFIVQAASLDAAREAVLAAGGSITHELGIIDAVAANLEPAQAEKLRRSTTVTLFADRPAAVTGTVDPGPPSDFVTQTGAVQLHAQGLTGKGVTVAILDTGMFNLWPITKDIKNYFKVKAQYDAIANTVYVPPSGKPPLTTDQSGHGTHITTIIASKRQDVSGNYNGMAPDAGVSSPVR